MKVKFFAFAACIAAIAYLNPVNLRAQTTAPASNESSAALSCNDQTFDHVLEFRYEESGKTGCVGWNEGASTCLYRDNWDTGRGTDNVKCKFSGGKLKVSWFLYPGAEGENKKARLKATIRGIDSGTNCFRKMDWEWKTGSWRSTGKGFPYGPSKCP